MGYSATLEWLQNTNVNIMSVMPAVHHDYEHLKNIFFINCRKIHWKWKFFIFESCFSKRICYKTQSKKTISFYNTITSSHYQLFVYTLNTRKQISKTMHNFVFTSQLNINSFLFPKCLLMICVLKNKLVFK